MFAESAAATLRGCGFAVPTTLPPIDARPALDPLRAQILADLTALGQEPPPAPAPRHWPTRPKILLAADVRGWAFDVNLRDLAEYVDGFDFAHWYVADGEPFPADGFDAVYLPYLRWSIVGDGVVPLQDAFGALRSAWFRPEAPGPPDPRDVDLVNRLRAWHVVTAAALEMWAPVCPRTVYLTNPVNMRRYLTIAPRREKIVASWNGNARHTNAAGQDVKGFWSLLQPACKQARVPMEFVEYGTSRVPPEEMPAFYRRANVALCASLYEGASNSVMEAMAAGQALISTDAGNVREMQASQLEHLGDSGIVIVAERTPEAFARALRSLTPARAQEMGAINRNEIAQRWSWDAWADRYRAFFEGGRT